jgi:hypothetical protein
LPDPQARGSSNCTTIRSAARFQVAGKADTVVGKTDASSPRMFVRPGVRAALDKGDRMAAANTFTSRQDLDGGRACESERCPKGDDNRRVNRKYKAGELKERKAEADKSRIIIEGLHACFYPVAESSAPRVRAAQSRGNRRAAGVQVLRDSGSR